MNKKSLAMAMSAITVVSAAAPVFAAEIPSGNTTVSKSKYKDVADDLVKAAEAGDRISAVYHKEDGTTVNIATVNADNKDYIKTTMNNLKAGEYIDFSIQPANVSSNELLRYDNAGVTTAKTNYTAASKVVPVMSNEIGGKLVEVAANKAAALATLNAQADYTPKTEDAIQTALKAYIEMAAPTMDGNVWSAKITAASSAAKVYVLKDSAASKVGTAAAVGTVADDDLIELELNANLSIKTGDLDLKVGDSSTPAEVKVDKDGKITGFVESGKKDPSSTPQAPKTLRVIAGSEKTVTVSSDSKDVAKDLASQYVFAPSELQAAITKVDAFDSSNKDDNSYYKVTLYPTGKRLQGFSSYKANSNYFDGTAGADTPVILTIKSTSLSTLKDTLDDLKTYNNSYSDVSVVAGSDRIETALAISEKYYNNSTDGVYSTTNASGDKIAKEANNVVLVGADAIVDGLVASPLAADKEAPLLLTGKDKLDSGVKSEIKRVLGLKTSTGIAAKKTVYIAGGTNSVSKDVEKELTDMGLKVERLSGEDRYATSLKIADEIGFDNKKAYVVGGTGLADAMSIASVASNEKNPIVVVDGKGTKLSSEAEDLLDNSNVDIIGGLNSVSKDMENAIESATGNTPERYKGEDRQATNASVIKNYFEKTSSYTGVKDFFVAKDGSTKEDQLVDALAIAPVAGVKKAPVILSTDSLSSDQSVALSKVVIDDKDLAANQTKSLTQAGKGIADSVINKIKDLLDM